MRRVGVFISRMGRVVRELRRATRTRAAIFARRLMSRWTFVAITGSCGKTTSTALLAHILGAPSPHLLTRGLNNAHGAARAILHLAWRRPGAAVFEVTGHAPNAIRSTTRVIRPDVGIITVIGLDHTSAFGPIEATADEKIKLATDLPANGLAVLNGDDALIMERSGQIRARVVTFGSSSEATLRLHSLQDAWPLPLMLDVEWRGDRFKINSQLAGRQSVAVLLACLLTALELGIERKLCVERIQTFEPLMNRMSIHPLTDGRVFMLDAWKAPQWALQTCLSFLGTASAPRKTVVLGTLSDVRGNSRRRYEETARFAMSVADRVIFVGEESARVRRLRDDEASGRLFRFDHVKDVHAFLSGDRVAGELIYIKGSRADHLERLLHANFAEVSCWRYRCGKRFQGCSYCRYLFDRPIRDSKRRSTLPWLTEQQRLPV
jgi:UDP-N-acetylmuramoyl-tripeptide--D-alanyl-D-alanine ligase